MKKFMPLWFLDIITAEQKLNSLSSKGLCLTAFSPLTGTFSFENSESESCIYRICYQKNCNGNPPKGLATNGWESVCGSRNIYVVKNSDINTASMPSYKFWQRINRILLFVLSFFCCFFLGMISGALSESVESGINPFEKTFFPFAIISAVILIAFLSYLFVVNRKLAKNNMDLNLQGKIKTIPAENFIYTPQEEKEMLKDGRMMKKSPLGWFYEPDKAEKMVEKLASEGWKFYRFNKLGTVFYFVKSDPCKLKFVVDYQNETSDEYFRQGKDDGWKLEFTSISRMTSFIIWSKEYTDSEPEFYSDPTTMVSRAKRMAMCIGIPFIALAAFYILLAILYVTDTDETLPLYITVFTVVIIEFVAFASKTIGYYMRIRKKYN